jgi:hypothetical protein
MRAALIKLKTLEETAKLRPEGYLEACLMPPAQIQGEWVVIPAHRYSALRRQFGNSRPNMAKRIRAFVQEIKAWKKAGWKITKPSVFFQRNLACATCPYSVRELLGIRTCGRCGCTRAKLFLENARCPEKKWKL